VRCILLFPTNKSNTTEARCNECTNLEKLSANIGASISIAYVRQRECRDTASFSQNNGARSYQLPNGFGLLTDEQLLNPPNSFHALSPSERYNTGNAC